MYILILGWLRTVGGDDMAGLGVRGFYGCLHTVLVQVKNPGQISQTIQLSWTRDAIDAAYASQNSDCPNAFTTTTTKTTSTTTAKIATRPTFAPPTTTTTLGIFFVTIFLLTVWQD